MGSETDFGVPGVEAFPSVSLKERWCFWHLRKEERQKELSRIRPVLLGEEGGRKEVRILSLLSTPNRLGDLL